MFKVHIYDFKDKKTFPTTLPVNDPFNPIVKVGRFEVYDTNGELIVSSGRRRVKNLAYYGTDDARFLPLALLRGKFNNTNLRIIDVKNVDKSRHLAHAVVTVA